jgi:protein ImuB
MFACLYSLSAPPSDLVKVAQDFTPRFETIGPLVMLDLSGLSRLFGSAREIGEQLRRSTAGAPVRIAIASSQTAAALLALGRPGLTVVSVEEQPTAIAALPVTLLGELEKLRKGELASAPVSRPVKKIDPPQIGDMEDVLPYFQSCLDRTSELASKPHAQCGGGWMHPRDTHGAELTKRARRSAPDAPGARVAPVLKDIQSLLDVLRRWGVKTLGAFAVLPAGEVYERLGARGVAWQRLAQGEDQGPLVPCVPEDPFEGALELEWPIEGLEPLSFVLARLFEPLAERLERADRGAAILHTHLRLTTRDVHARTVQLPAPMRDPKTLRTLVLLDLESNPPSAAIDRVRVLVEPTPAKVLQWTLYDRAQPSPEQVSTLIARLTALVGEGHVGSPKLVDSWKPGAFEMAAFGVPSASGAPVAPAHRTAPDAPGALVAPGAPGTALRRFRLPIPARVQMQDGRPLRVMVDRRGVTGGVVEQSAGPWRTSGEWWNAGQVGQVGRVGKDTPHQPHQTDQSWDRDEWDVLLNGGAAYRIFVERTVGQWFIEGVID